MLTKNHLENEREKLNQLISMNASKDDILKQSQILDELIYQHYKQSA